MSAACVGDRVVSYGNQLNIFRAKSDKYGRDWRGIICCNDRHEAKLASEDALQFLGGHYNKSSMTLTLANGAQLLIRVVTCMMEAQRAFIGREFTQIAWLHRPTDSDIIGLARARLRSRAVPADDWRYEYCTVR